MLILDMAFDQTRIYPDAYPPMYMYIISVTWLLLQFLILLCSYTANLASIITTSAITPISLTNVTSLDSLKGTQVLTYSTYVKQLEFVNGIKATGLDWDEESSWQYVTEQLKSGNILAYIDDMIILQASLGKDACAMDFVGGLINPFSYGYAFSPRFDFSLFQDFNAGIMEVQVGVSTMLPHKLWILQSLFVCMPAVS